MTFANFPELGRALTQQCSRAVLPEQEFAFLQRIVLVETYCRIGIWIISLLFLYQVFTKGIMKQKYIQRPKFQKDLSLILAT